MLSVARIEQISDCVIYTESQVLHAVREKNVTNENQARLNLVVSD